MNSENSKTAAIGEPVLADLVDRLTSLLAAGDASAVEELIGRHPQHAERLRAILPTLEILAGFNDNDLTAQKWDRATEELGVLGDYRLLREIGRGGMGVVYEAEQISLRRRVAVKVLPLAGLLDRRALARFRAEAQVAAGLHHTNIVPIYGVGCERGVHFYAMQYIEGLSLDRLIGAARGDSPSGATTQPRAEASEAPSAPAFARPSLLIPQVSSLEAPQSSKTDPLALLSTRRMGDESFFRRVAELGVQAAEALQYAHERGVIHRDIKPGNLMLDKFGQLWIADFGVARLEGADELTATGDVLGTLRYMSPEQAVGQVHEVDCRTDIYSLGATLYELLALRPVFGDQRREELLHQLTNADPASLRRHVPRMPADLETIIFKSLAKAPADRYPAASELANDLKRFCEGRTIRARRPSLLQRGGKWARRNRAIVRVMLASVVLLSLVAGVSAWRINNEQMLRRLEASTARKLQQVIQEQVELDAYADSINAASHAQGGHNLEGMAQSLEEQVPKPGKRDLRGFEWRYLWNQWQSRPQPFGEHEGEAYCARFSPDGRWLATSGTDGVRIWEWPSKKQVRRLREAIADVNGVAWSPDGKLLAAFSDDLHLRIYGVDDWRPVRTLAFEGHLAGGEFTPDGQMLVVAERRGNLKDVVLGADRVHLIDARSWQPIHQFRDPTASTQGVAVSSDGRLAAVACSDGFAYVYDLAERRLKHRLKTEFDRPHPCTAVAFATDRSLLAVASARILIFDPHDGRLLANGQGGAEGLAFTKDGHSLLSAHRNNQASLWQETPTGEWKVAASYPHLEPLWSVAVHDDGSIITTGRSGGVAQQSLTRPQDRRRFVGDTAVIRRWLKDAHASAAAFDEYSQRAAAADIGSSPAEFRAIAWAPDGREFVVGDSAGVISFWEMPSLRPLSATRLSGQKVTSLAYSSDGSYVSADNWYLRVVQRYPIRSRAAGFGDSVGLKTSFSKNSETLFVATNDPQHPLAAVDVPTFRDAPERVPDWWREPFASWPETGADLTFALANFDSTAMRPITALLRQDNLSFTVSGDAQVLAAFDSVKDTFSIWAAPGWQERKNFSGLLKSFVGMTLSADGATLAVLMSDNHVYLWHTPSGRLLLTLNPRLTHSFNVSFSPDGRHLICIGQGLRGNAEIVVWDAPPP